MAIESAYDLRQQLEKIEADLQGKISPEITTVMHKATEELISSGAINKALHEGDRAPAFTLPNAVGRLYRLADGLSRGPVVATFYRGAW